MTGPLANVEIAILLAFAFGALVAVWSSVVIAGFLPLRNGPQTGTMLVRVPLICGAVLLTVVLIAVLVLTVPMLPAAVAVVVVGLAILGGPFLVEPIPERFRDSTLTLAATVALTLITLVALPWPF